MLVGQDLIRAAGVRAQLSQIEKYDQATSTFKGKYGYLPGDINAVAAATFGFAPRGTLPGEGDGNGAVSGTSGAILFGPIQQGETLMFWVDLTTAGLIDQSFTRIGVITNTGACGANGSMSAVVNCLPSAKIGQANFVYVWSDSGIWGDGSIPINDSQSNYYGLSAISSISSAFIFSTPGLSVRQAYMIDSKIDDGLPQSGRVTAQYVDRNSFGNTAVGWAGTPLTGTPYTTATQGTATSCFDNGNSSGATQQYSLDQNNGAGVNCALSFQMQGAGR